ncbi:MAG: T9SS type A sorting domain-containing protein [Bacteroidetes bacterium]|nr:T9SS type A sorting domain-containing protein [Bacteroidota bacterium]
MALINRFKFFWRKNFRCFIVDYFFSSVRSPGQIITSFSINPPVLNDTTSFDIYITSIYPDGPCDLHIQSYSVFGSIVEAQSEHCIGSLGSSCISTDTFHLTPLVAGTYIFRYDLSYTLDSASCTGIAGTNSYSTSISVFPIITGVESDIADIKYSFHGNQLYLPDKYSDDDNSITVFNFSGLEVFNKKLYGIEVIDLSELSDGIYFCCLFVNQNNISLNSFYIIKNSRKIIKFFFKNMVEN